MILIRVVDLAGWDHRDINSFASLIDPDGRVFPWILFAEYEYRLKCLSTKIATSKPHLLSFSRTALIRTENEMVFSPLCCGFCLFLQLNLLLLTMPMTTTLPSSRGLVNPKPSSLLNPRRPARRIHLEKSKWILSLAVITKSPLPVNCKSSGSRRHRQLSSLS